MLHKRLTLFSLLLLASASSAAGQEPVDTVSPKLQGSPQEQATYTPVQVEAILVKARAALKVNRLKSMDTLDALQRLGPQAAPAVPWLVPHFLQRETIHSVASVLNAIGEAAVPAYEEALVHPDAHIRYEALTYMGNLRSSDTDFLPAQLQSTVLESTRAKDVCIRQKAVFILQGFGLDVLPVLRQVFLHDPDPEVQYWAGRSLSNLAVRFKREVNRDELTPLFIDALQSPNPKLRTIGGEGLTSTLTETWLDRTLPLLLKAQEDPEPAVRSQATGSVNNFV